MEWVARPDLTSDMRLVELARRATRERPELIDCWYIVGEKLLREGSIDAITFLEEAKSVHEGQARLHIMLADAYRQLGRRDEARGALVRSPPAEEHDVDTMLRRLQLAMRLNIG